MKKIGILGGTFNPPHIGHLWIAEEVRVRKQLDEIWFIPTRTPPHKKTSVLDASHRLGMLKLAVKGNPYFQVNALELERDGKSYTYDTIKELTMNYPEVDFSFIIGGDMVEYLPKWYLVEELMEMVHFIGVTRPGYTLETPYPVDRLEIHPLDISSTFIRNRLKEGELVRYLLPDDVMNYIKENQIYGYRDPQA
ncbi:nicotinate-nucleotide adenylyltransferase [Oceanobacillus jeddahense]|uniref:Probable nicotinate-nucleotide adenylyltransferase n=1 Tax=Oceanobacillus jeddahense TaxID=1462527 RepID=A0ABY5JPP3_9BACI|nr:nicotinate-nucleotide adenylyltransferase [Oceanobacillus jeddahense]UUI01452.1 nicotinate-nucleotide adenylyltransferase [Oceanobacillus jeddahense]